VSDLTIGWKVSSSDSKLASLRYRAMIPILALEKYDIENKIFIRANRENLKKLDVLVIVKSFTIEDYKLALDAADQKVPVIFDLCDNIFIDEYVSKTQILPVDVFMLIANIATAITVTTEPLAVVVRVATGGRIPVYVIPDGIENRANLIAIKKRLLKLNSIEVCRAPVIMFGKFTLLRKIDIALKSATIFGIFRILLKLAYRYFDAWRAYLTGKAPRISANISREIKLPLTATKKVSISIQKADQYSKKILWFGNHGANHAQFGMLDLLLIQETLENLALELSVELIVVSNNFEKYTKNIQPMAIPSRYVEWSAETMADSFRYADVVIIPNSLDGFSICKSANRTVLAISNGIPVVATSTPALVALRDCIILDDFEYGIKRYLTDSELSRLHVQKAQDLIEELYGQQVICNLWRNVIDEVVLSNGLYKMSENMSIDLIVAVHLPQDIVLAFPVIEEAQAQGLKCSIWTNTSAIKRWPSLLDTIRNWGGDWKLFSEDLVGFDISCFPKTTFALLSMTESNLNPHRFTHKLTKLANSAGLYTASMQHGYENIGLSYSDDLHKIQNIKFASQRIYTWGGSETLHSDVPLKTRTKCISVGCPKPAFVNSIELPDEIGRDSLIIGIFENLHWHRYSDEYRVFFLEGVSYLADLYPNIVFLVKPHNAGAWLTERYKGEKPVRSNLVIADPASKQWADITAPQLLSHLAAVITTPSTVALDSARILLPTAVVAQTIDLENYSPLPLIRNVDDWSAFIEQVLNNQEQLQDASKRFVDRAIIPSEKAAWRIIDDIKSHKKSQKQENENAA